jgi:excisionase family DNA binding protein
MPDRLSSPQYLLDVPAAARSLGVGRTTVFQLIRDGRLESVLIGRRRLIPIASIEAYVARLRAGPEGEPDKATDPLR